MRRIYYHLYKLGEKDNLTTKWIMLVSLVLIISFLFPQGISIESDYPVGMIWTENDLIASFAFPIYKDEFTYQEEREQAAQKIHMVFEEEPERVKQSFDSVSAFFQRMQFILDRRKDDTLRDQALTRIPIRFTESEWRALWTMRERDRKSNTAGTGYSLGRLQRDVLLVMNGLYLDGIVNVRKREYPKGLIIAKRKKTIEQLMPLENYLDSDDLGSVVQQTFISGYHGENDTVSIATKIALSFIIPNIIFQLEQTSREIQFAMDAVPRTIGAVQEGERIISKKERVTKEIKLKLDSLRKSKQERGASINKTTSFIGKYLHVFSIIWLLVMYLYLFRKKIYHDNGKLLLVTLLFLLTSLMAYFTVEATFVLPLRYLIFVPAISMLLTILFDSRVAFYGTVCIALIIAGIRSNDYSIAISSIIAGSFAVYTVRDIKKRTQIFRSIIYIFLGYVLIIVALGLERFDSPSQVLNQILIAALNAIISPIITYGLLIFFERGFKVSTDLTLLELSDLNHPLLKELSHKAPGTFHHSVSVAALAETAAEAIGANAILARVGAYYHDIGKTLNPHFFVENQLTNENKHRVMSPRKSARIIAAHVADGIQLARKHNIPEAVIKFIPMHHGTIRIGTFYEKALRQKRKNTEIDENDFRYSGPKPNSKETAILMLADGVEASTRSIDTPTVEKIEANIDTLMKARFLDGELEDSTLTFRDLTKIKEAFLKILIGVYHSRIRYTEEQNPASPEEPPALSPRAKREKTKRSTEARLQKRIDSIDTP